LILRSSRVGTLLMLRRLFPYYYSSVGKCSNALEGICCLSLRLELSA
jgi:hypothetical protein